jgi:hypothetical protein
MGGVFGGRRGGGGGGGGDGGFSAAQASWERERARLEADRVRLEEAERKQREEAAAAAAAHREQLARIQDDMAAAGRRTDEILAEVRRKEAAWDETRTAMDEQLKGVTDRLAAIDKEKADRQAALDARTAAERARLAAIGMDNEHDYNFAFVGETGA